MASSDDTRLTVGARGDAPAWPQRLRQALTTLVYRSRVAQWPTPGDLRRLLNQSQTRNREAGLTGLLLYDGGRFFQWLEGPGDVVHRVWDAIRRDPRHTDVELLGWHPVQLRLFSGWSMKLACRPVALGLSGLDGAAGLMVPSPDAFARLASRPDSVAAVLADLSDQKPRNPPPPLRPEARGAAFRGAWGRPICDAVIPRLLEAHPVRGLRPAPGDVGPKAPRPSAADVGELARRAIGDNPESAWEWIEGFCRRGMAAGSLFLHLLEPAARRLGDLWADDHCLDADVTLGLYRLQLAARRLGPMFHRENARLRRPRTVLVTLQPGERDMLGPTLASEYFWRDGWDVKCEYPHNVDALCRVLADTHFDALHLTLNAAFRRQHRLPEMAEDIRALRAASRNPAIIVVLSGRDCVDRMVTASATGADACCASAADGVRRADEALGAFARRNAALH